jgi:Transposase domain (DUF772)
MVMMFMMLVIQAANNLSDEHTEFLINDRPSFMRFLGLGLSDLLPAIPAFGYQNHLPIDRGFGLIRKWRATDAAAYDGARLREGLLDKTDTAAGVWANTACKKPKGRPMPQAMRRANAVKSMIRSRVEDVFAERNGRMGGALH